MENFKKRLHINDFSLVLNIVVSYLEKNDETGTDAQLRNICMVSKHFNKKCSNILNIRFEKNTLFADADYYVSLVFGHFDYIKRRRTSIPFTLHQLANTIQNIERRLFGKIVNKIKLHSCSESGLDFNSIIPSSEKDNSIRFATSGECKIEIQSEIKGSFAYELLQMQDCPIIDLDGSRGGTFTYCMANLNPRGDISLYQYRVVIEEICRQTGAKIYSDNRDNDILPVSLNNFQKWIFQNRFVYRKFRFSYIRECMQSIIFDQLFPKSENPIEYWSYIWWKFPGEYYNAHKKAFILLYKQFALHTNIELWNILEPYIALCSHENCGLYTDYDLYCLPCKAYLKDDGCTCDPLEKLSETKWYCWEHY